MLLAIPVLAASGFVLRTAVAVSGIGTALLGVPLAPIGFVAAFAFLLLELFVGSMPVESND